jgi:ABC-2 type transport system ATP-binding protein
LKAKNAIMSPIIEIKDLSKKYGKRTAVNHLNLTVEAGEIFGFVGPNGAGKTTTLRILATLLRANGGEAFVAGHSVKKSPRGVRGAIGYMPDSFGIYHDMRVWEYLDFFGACYHLRETERKRLVNDLLELVDMTPRRDDMVDKLSRGMQQRLGLARTLIHDPQVLILDEPASGLDPRARVEIRELLVELARMGKTVFFSTHILADVAEICTRVGIIEAGQIVATGTLDELQRGLATQRAVHIGVLDRVAEAQEFLSALPGVSDVEVRTEQNHQQRTRLEVKFTGDDAALSTMLTGLAARSIPIVHFSEDSQNLEDIFMQLTKSSLE